MLILGRSIFARVSLLLLVLHLSCGISPAQSPAADASRAVPPADNPSASDGLAPMHNQIRDIASKIAAALAPLRTERTPLAFTFTNISSLGEDDAAPLGEFLKSELIARKFYFPDSGSPAANLHVTLSQGIDGYLLVAELPQGLANQAILIPLTVPQRLLARKSIGITLEEKLVWDQPEKILDFALLPSPSPEAGPGIVVLEPARLVFYTRKENQWELDRAIAIPSPQPDRDIRGSISLSENGSPSHAQVPRTECAGDFTHPETVTCSSALAVNAIPVAQDEDDSIPLDLKCDGRAVSLGTGKGDWTQPDFIQAFEDKLDDGQKPEHLASGSPIQFSGPVTSLSSAGEQGGARAVVRNLQTGNYEAYLVTATCGQ